MPTPPSCDEEKSAVGRAESTPNSTTPQLPNVLPIPKPQLPMGHEEFGSWRLVVGSPLGVVELRSWELLPTDRQPVRQARRQTGAENASLRSIDRVGHAAQRERRSLRVVDRER